LYGDPVNVQARDDGRPARFVWRGRLYTVHAILEHWVINREWWQDPEAEPGQPELEFWRVEASPGQGMTAGVYELRRDAATDAWTLRGGALLSPEAPQPAHGCGSLTDLARALPQGSWYSSCRGTADDAARRADRPVVLGNARFSRRG
jgi:hypothetical protein